MGREDPLNLTTIKNKESLESLNLAQLKLLATKYNVKAKGKVVEGFFSDHVAQAGKTQYIKALSKVIAESDIELAKTSTPTKPVVKKKRKKSSSWW